MNTFQTLSYKYNMSMGYLPVVIFFILCEFTTHDVAIYISTGIALLASIYNLTHKQQAIQLLLYATTVMLVLLSLSHLIIHGDNSKHFYSFTMEISTIIPSILILINQKQLTRFIEKSIQPQEKQSHLTRSFEASIVSARITVLLITLHLTIVLILLIFLRPFSRSLHSILFYIMPPTLILLIIIINQLFIVYFNQMMKQTPFLPIVNKRGDVIGRSSADDVLLQRSSYIHPIIRIAIVIKDKIYLAPRPQRAFIEINKTDITLETHLLYGEELEQGIIRLLKRQMLDEFRENLNFHFIHYIEKNNNKRLVYFFTLTLEEDVPSLLGNTNGAKLWTLRQISHNLRKHFFSYIFEQEYEELKRIIYTREKYKES